MYVCMCACMHVCMYVRMYILTYVCMYVCMHVVSMYACYVLCMYVCIYACMYVCMHGIMYMHAWYACILYEMCMYHVVRMYVLCMCMCVCHMNVTCTGKMNSLWLTPMRCVNKKVMYNVWGKCLRFSVYFCHIWHAVIHSSPLRSGSLTWSVPLPPTVQTWGCAPTPPRGRQAATWTRISYSPASQVQRTHILNNNLLHTKDLIDFPQNCDCALKRTECRCLSCYTGITTGFDSALADWLAG